MNNILKKTKTLGCFWPFGMRLFVMIGFIWVISVNIVYATDLAVGTVIDSNLVVASAEHDLKIEYITQDGLSNCDYDCPDKIRSMIAEGGKYYGIFLDIVVVGNSINTSAVNRSFDGVNSTSCGTSDLLGSSNYYGYKADSSGLIDLGPVEINYGHPSICDTRNDNYYVLENIPYGMYALSAGSYIKSYQYDSTIDTISKNSKYSEKNSAT